MAFYYYSRYGFWTLVYMMLIEFPICVLLVNLMYYLKKPFHLGEAVTVNNYKMVLDPSDKGVSKELFVFGIREPGSTRLMENIVKEDSICVDIGANIGYYVLLESLKATKGRVYAIEPVQGNYNILRKNIFINHCKNVDTYKYAIGDHKGEVEMVVPDKKNLSYIPHDLPQREHALFGTNIEHEKVPLTTLDEFCLKNGVTPDLVRMDVEGHEIYIIQGMTRTLERMRKGSWIFIEMHLTPLGHDGINEIYSLLDRNGFKEIHCLREGKNPEIFNYGHIRKKFPGLEFPPIKHTMSFFMKVTP